MDLSIIIINWNSRDYVAACLDSVYQHAPSLSFEVIVVDSGSFDGCGEMISRDFPQVRFIQSPENLGFSRANNLGVSHARGDVYFFLNPDTEVLPGAITALYEVARDDRNAGAVGARLLNTDGSLQTSCVQAFPTILNQILMSDFLIRLFPTSCLWGKAALFNEETVPEEVEAVSGAAIMMRREIFEKIGGFCDEYFMYSEDIDLCYEAQSAGFKNLYVPTAEIIHHGGGSSKRQPSSFASVMKVECQRKYLARHRGTLYAAMFRIACGAGALVRIGILSTIGRSSIFRQVMISTSDASIARWQVILRWSVGGKCPLSPSHS